jgi:hypothetical protein
LFRFSSFFGREGREERQERQEREKRERERSSFSRATVTTNFFLVSLFPPLTISIFQLPPLSCSSKRTGEFVADSDSEQSKQRRARRRVAALIIGEHSPRGRASKKKPSRRVVAQLLFSFSFSPKKTKDMDAHKLTGRLALAAIVVAAMQVSGGERGGKGERGRRS